MLYCCRWIGSIPMLSYKGKDIQIKKSKREEGEVAIITVIADIGGGEKRRLFQWQQKEQKA